MNDPLKAMPNYGGYTIKEVARFEVEPGSDLPGPWRVVATGNAQAFAVGEYGTPVNSGSTSGWGIVALPVVKLPTERSQTVTTVVVGSWPRGLVVAGDPRQVGLRQVDDPPRRLLRSKGRSARAALTPFPGERVGPRQEGDDDRVEYRDKGRPAGSAHHNHPR